MEMHEINKRNAVLKELMLSAANRSFWDLTLAMTDESLANMPNIDWKAIDTAFIVGHGTSLATASNAETYLSHIAGISARALPAFQFQAYPNDYIKRPKNTLVIGVSCSGNTASVVESLEAARNLGCKTLCLSGEGDHNCAKVSELRIITDCLIERRGETSHPYSVSHLFLLLGAYKLSIIIGQERDTLTKGEAAYWTNQLDKALTALSFLPELYDRMGQVAKRARDAGAINQIVLGSGPNYGTMIEGALKISEFCWKLGAGEELEDFAHGRFREIDSITPLFIISPAGPCCAKTMDLLAGASIADTNTIVLTDEPSPAMRKLAKTIVEMPTMESEYLTPFLYVFALWFYGYHINADCGQLVGGARYGLLATDINFSAHFDAEGNHL